MLHSDLHSTQKKKAVLVCLTGGIATGKSRVANWFTGKGWNILCADEIVHHLYEPGQELPKEIAREFGPSVLTAEGGIDRSSLGKIVFQDESALKRLMGLVHPRVRKVWKKAAAESICNEKKTIVVIPLVYETQTENEFDQIWVVACSAKTQQTRLYQRGFNEIEIERRLKVQWPLQRKIDFADRVIWNNDSWPLTEEQLARLLTYQTSKNENE